MHVTRPLRLRGGGAPRNSANHELPRTEWIEIPVPTIISEETFALANELLEANKKHAPRRTITPSALQGLSSCAKCGYGLYRTSTRSSARTIHYYRCLGSDGWRRLGGPVCDSRPMRQDLPDEVVRNEIARLLEDRNLIEDELERRLKAARNADPTQRREETLRPDFAPSRKSIERLLTAYQESLLSLEELRGRIPDLRSREQACLLKLQAIEDQSKEREVCLHLAESVTSFLDRLRSSVGALDIIERRRVLRLHVLFERAIAKAAALLGDRRHAFAKAGIVSAISWSCDSRSIICLWIGSNTTSPTRSREAAVPGESRAVWLRQIPQNLRLTSKARALHHRRKQRPEMLIIPRFPAIQSTKSNSSGINETFR